MGRATAVQALALVAAVLAVIFLLVGESALLAIGIILLAVTRMVT